MKINLKLLILSVALVVVFRLDAQNASSDSKLFSEIFSGSSYFIENKGQIVSMENRTPVPSVLFHTNGNSSDIYIKTTGISYVLKKIEVPEIKPDDPYPTLNNSFKGEWERIDMVLIGSNKNAEIIKEGQSDYYENYYLSQCPSGITNVYGYKKVILKNIYPHIDWVISFNEKDQLKYDFIVHPKGNPADIKIQYKWADKPELNSDGSISINGPLGNIIEGKTLVFQDKIVISSSWHIQQDSTLEIITDNYDKNKDLIIDPILLWATYCGGSANDPGYCIKSDGTSVFVTGLTASVNFPTLDPGTGAYFQGTFAGGGSGDAFILKFDTNGVRQWATYYGGANDDIPRSLSVNTNNVFITGQTLSNDFPTFDLGSGAYYQATNANNLVSDAFILRFDKNGIRDWSTYFGGNFWDAGYSVFTTDSYLYFSFVSSSSDMPIYNPGGGAYINTYTGNTDYYLLKMSVTGIPVWGTYFGGTNNEGVFEVFFEFNGDIYLAGGTSSPDFPVMNPGGTAFYQGNLSGSSDIVISRFTSNGNLTWSTYLGGTVDESVRSFATNNNKIWLGGFTSSSNAPTVNPGNGSYYQGSTGGGNDGILVSFNTNNELIWGTYYGGNSSDYISDIHADNYSLWISGRTFSANFPTLDPGMGTFFQGTKGSGYDAFFAKFKQNGIRQWSTFYGGAGNEESLSMFSDNTNLWATGYTSSNNFLTLDAGNGAYYQPVFGGGGNDAFILKFDVCIKPNVTITPSSTVICLLDTTTLVANGALSYQWQMPIVNNDSLLVSPAVDSTYTVIGTDDMSCSNSANISITVNPLPQLIITQPDSVCFGDSITLHITSDLPSYYLWSVLPPATDSTLTVTPDTVNHTFNYFVLVTDTVNGCKNATFTSVYTNSLPQLTVTQPDSICFGDSIPLTVHSNLPSYYLWTPVNGTDSTLIVSPDTVHQTFTYNVLVTDTVNGCRSSISTSIYVNALPQLTITNPDSICFGDSITLTVHSDLPAYYLWTPFPGTDSSLTVSPDTVHQTFTYNVLVTDTLNGCKSSATTSVFVNALPQLTISQPDSICFKDSITLEVHSDLPSYYTWSPGIGTDSLFTVSPGSINAATAYSVVVTDTVNGCISMAFTSVFVNPLPQLIITPPDSICNGDTITLQILSDLPSFYHWSPGNGTDSTQSTYSVHPDVAYQTFTYSLIATDTVNGCKNYDTTSVYVHGKPEIFITSNPSNHAICSYDSITFTVQNTDSIYLYSYNWTPNLGSDSSVVFYPPQSDTLYQFSVIGTSVYNCKDTASTFAIIHPAINVSITSSDQDTAICYRDNIILTAVGNNINTYLWSPSISDSTNSSINIMPISTSTYSVLVTSLENCIATDTITVIVYPLPTFSVRDTTICFGNSVTVGVFNTFNSAATYSWTPGNLSGISVTVSPQDTTTYLVTSLDSNACHYSMPLTVNVDSLPIATITGINRICYGESTTLSASGGTSFLWTPVNSTSNTITVTPLTTSSYQMIANSTICYDTTSVTVTVDPKPVISVTHDTTLIIGMSVPLNVTGADTYDWSPIDDLSCVNCSNPVAKPYSTIEYCVLGTNTYGCLDTACVNVTIDAECGEVFVPSAFSPNGDGKNDVLYVYGKCIKSMEFRIFNRWGEKVFESTDPDIGWDGSYRGKDADTDVFVYYLKAEYYIGTKVDTKGNITLMH